MVHVQSGTSLQAAAQARAGLPASREERALVRPKLREDGDLGSNALLNPCRVCENLSPGCRLCRLCRALSGSVGHTSHSVHTCLPV
eukprot:5381183-Prymnesium_polylepis.1